MFVLLPRVAVVSPGDLLIALILIGVGVLPIVIGGRLGHRRRHGEHQAGSGSPRTACWFPEQGVEPRVLVANVGRYLRGRDYYAAYECMLRHTNWFFVHRSQLPVEFSHVWLMLRNRVNRMLTIHRWPQDWAQRDLEYLREEALRLVERAELSLGEPLRAEARAPLSFIAPVQYRPRANGAFLRSSRSRDPLSVRFR